MQHLFGYYVYTPIGKQYLLFVDLDYIFMSFNLIYCISY